MKANNSDVMMVAELDTDDAISFLLSCKSSGKSVSEMLTEIVKNFLDKGDNHLGQKSA